MPIEDGTYVELTADEIYDRLVSAFEEQFDTTVQAGDLVQKQLRAQAVTLAQNQEDALREVYESAYIEDATGEELDKLTNRIGIERRDAVPATGIVEFAKTVPPTATYTIPRGTTVQTDGFDPLAYDTTDATALRLIEGAEDGNINGWTGDVDGFTVVSSSFSNGNNAVEIANADGNEITYGETTFNPIKEFSIDFNNLDGNDVAVRLYVTDGDDFVETGDVFELIIKGSTDELTINYIRASGTTELTETVSASTPIDDSPKQLRIGGGRRRNVVATLFDGVGDTSGNSIGSVSSTSFLTANDIELRIGTVSMSSTAQFDTVAITKAAATVEAVTGDADTNVTSDVVTNSASTLAGVDAITNPVPIGDNEYYDASGSTLVQGRDRETDEQLRERALESNNIGGAATVGAIEASIEDVPHVDSLKVYQNTTNTDNANGNGLPSHSFEAVVNYTGADEDIGQAIFDAKAVDSQTVGGNQGNLRAIQISSEVLDDDEPIEFSKATEVDIDINVTLIVDDTYIGDDRIRERMVREIGGTLPNGTIVNGLDVGEDLYVAVLKDAIVSPSDTGVWEVDSITIDTDGDGTDDTQTLGNGADVIDVSDASGSVLRTNGRDGSITISTVDK